MLDTMTMVKAFGWFLGAFLAFLLSKWVAEEVYHIGGSGHGDHHDQAYSIDTGGDDEVEEEEEVIDVAALMASADAGAGERVFSKCKACHKLDDGANGTGPHLYQVVGRDIGSIDGFGGYSSDLKEIEGDWTPENLFAFLESPKGFASGTKMVFNGLPKPTDRANLIAYLTEAAQ